jgi:hypothetical protein
MEPRLSLGTIICVLVAIAFGIYCLYPSAVLNRSGDEVHRRTHNIGSLMDQSQPPFIDRLRHPAESILQFSNACT